LLYCVVRRASLDAMFWAARCVPKKVTRLSQVSQGGRGETAVSYYYRALPLGASHEES